MIGEQLKTHEEFEGLLCPAKGDPAKYAPLVIVYFTARWCGACKRIDFNKIVNAPNSIAAKWRTCDVDVNNFTPGFCDVRAIPSFQAIIYGRCEPLFQSSSTDDIITWMKKMTAKMI
jgi:hypothetical protein